MHGFYVFLAVGMVAMAVCMVKLGKVYDMPAVKVMIAAVLLTVIGFLGIKLMFFIETGRWSGRSLYGSVFLVPVLMYPAALLLQLDYKELLDISAPAGSIMFSLMKVKCYIDGCCGGRIFNLGNDNVFVFPSQITEAAVNLIMAIVLYKIVKERKHIGYVYPYFMILYGSTRFVLNLLRNTKPWLLGMPAGNIWSIAAVAAGLISRHYLNRSSRTG